MYLLILKYTYFNNKRFKMRKIILLVLGVLLITLFSCKNNPPGSAINYGSSVDQEGKSFKTIKIGNQIWMAENLNVEHFNNGDSIPEIKNNEEWVQAGIKKKPAWCYYMNITSLGKKYGKLYNWYAVTDPRGLAPIGWHIPSEKEFKILMKSVGNDGNCLKGVVKVSDINKAKYSGTNTSGFTAFLAGYRNIRGKFKSLGDITAYWSFSDKYVHYGYAYNLTLTSWNNAISTLNSIQGNAKEDGFSVRCLKD